MQYETVGRISLWLNNLDQENAPYYTGVVEINGKDYRVALWQNDVSDSENRPQYSGQVEERVEEE